MYEPSKPIAIEGLEVRRTGLDVIVHDPQHEKIHILNRSAGDVLALCDGEHDPEQIAASLLAGTDAPQERVLDDVLAALATFRQLRFVR
jgi:Coenzyme PQQ synthesis protein D (PqqD)